MCRTGVVFRNCCIWFCCCLFGCCFFCFLFAAYVLMFSMVLMCVVCVYLRLLLAAACPATLSPAAHHILNHGRTELNLWPLQFLVALPNTPFIFRLCIVVVVHVSAESAGYGAHEAHIMQCDMWMLLTISASVSCTLNFFFSAIRSFAVCLCCLCFGMVCFNFSDTMVICRYSFAAARSQNRSTKPTNKQKTDETQWTHLFNSKSEWTYWSK